MLTRLDSSKGYEEGNLVPCCFVCNQIKGDRFSATEMELIGKCVGQVWRARLFPPASARLRERPLPALRTSISAVYSSATLKYLIWASI